MIFEPLDFIARLAALVPPPRMHLTRYHGVFAPHSRLRAAVTPARRGVAVAAGVWHRDRELCTLRREAQDHRLSIEEPEVIARILAHLERTATQPHQAEMPLGARAPPVPSRLL